jgi:signal transduction histidine kinase
MSRRSAILLGLLCVTLPAGAWLLSQENTPALTGMLHDGLPERIAKIAPATIAAYLERHLGYFITLIGNDAGLLLYGGLAFFGVVMMVLIVHHAASAASDSNRTALELLKQEKQRAENLARVKSEFLNQVSHELRTPLAVIIGYVECMTDGLYGQVESKHQEILQLVAKQSNHLKNMIDQILIFSRLEASKQPLRLADVSIEEIVGDVRDTFDFLCRQKGLTLGWDVPSKLPRLKTDPERVKEILSNLLQNAVKYTDHGSIAVAIRNSAGAESIVVTVTDSGIGIPENLLGVIFDPFVQVHKTSADNSRGGIGLGLSIVKRHVEQLGGTISAESAIGKGSTFMFALPVLYKTSRESNLARIYRNFKLRHLRLRSADGGGASRGSRAAMGSHWLH